MKREQMYHYESNIALLRELGYTVNETCMWHSQLEIRVPLEMCASMGRARFINQLLVIDPNALERPGISEGKTLLVQENRAGEKYITAESEIDQESRVVCACMNKNDSQWMASWLRGQEYFLIHDFAQRPVEFFVTLVDEAFFEHKQAGASWKQCFEKHAHRALMQECPSPTLLMDTFIFLQERFVWKAVDKVTVGGIIVMLKDAREQYQYVTGTELPIFVANGGDITVMPDNKSEIDQEALSTLGLRESVHDCPHCACDDDDWSEY